MNLNLEKDQTDKHRSPSSNWSIEHAKFLEISPNNSPKHGVEGSLSSIRTGRNVEDIHRRHDGDLNLSAKRKQNFHLSPIMALSPKSDSLATISPLTKKNRKFVVHLASEVDNELHKVPLYQNNVFEIRQQNDRILKQIMLSKQEYLKGYDKIAEEHRFGKFRSQSVHPRAQALLKPRLPNYTPSINDQKEENNSVQLSVSRGQNAKSNDENNNILSPSLQSNNHDASSWTTLPSKQQTEKPKLLKGLEEIYLQDLEKRIQSKEKIRSLSPEKSDFNQEENVKERRQPKNHKDFSGDHILLRKLKNPYAKKLPFEKPVNGNIRDETIKDLEAIQIKAEILRNIKKINRAIEKDIKSIEGLPRINEISGEEEGQAKQKGSGTKRRLKKKMLREVGRKDSENTKISSSHSKNKDL